MKRKVKKIHVVMGQTGEYSDHTSWPVAAYHSRKEAERHEIRATMRAKAIFHMNAAAGHPLRYDRARTRKLMGDLDTNKDMTIDYTGADYFTLSVPVRRTAPREIK